MIIISLESLQVKNQYFGSLVDLHLFFSQNEILTLRTVPIVILREDLRLPEQFEALLNVSSTFYLWLFIGVIKSVLFDLLQFFTYFLIILPPVELHFHFLLLISKESIQLFLIVGKDTAITALYVAILAVVKLGTRESEQPKRLLAFGYVDNLLLIVLNRIELFVIGVNSIVDLFSCHLLTEEI